MNYRTILLLLLAFVLGANTAAGKKPKRSQERTIEQWRRFEASFDGPSTGNPFTDVRLEAGFVSPSTGKVTTVRGFYDGDGVYRVRFMPSEAGCWRFTTHSNATELDGKTGSFVCTASPEKHAGMVKAVGKDFRFQDSTYYYPVGTTSYAWIHEPEDVERMTLASLRKAQFNKIRMCVFPKEYELVREKPSIFPYEILPQKNAKTQSGLTFDKTRFNPAFFRHLEQCLDSLDNIGCQADLILFHPYDKGMWGFDEMTTDENKLYLQYLEARASSFKNVWWSLSNEYDYVKAKTLDDWVELIKTVRENDPYGHLVSIHGSTATYFPFEKYGLTHASIQDEGPVMALGRASIVRNIYNIPVVFDEVRYEGNLKRRWGRMSGEEMLAEMWTGLTQGTYVTHGECYNFHDDDTIMWAQGGSLRGESWKRIPFMRRILADLPHPLQMADVSRDDMTATAGDGYYMVYFRDRMQDSWPFNLPQKNAAYGKLKAGTKFKVEVVDTWNMTVTPVDGIFEVGEANDYRMYDKDLRSVRLPLAPYLMLRIKSL